MLVPTSEAVQKLVAARLAADVMGVPTLIMARTDANSAHLLTSDIDPARSANSSPASAPSKASSAFAAASIRPSHARLAYAPYADLIWCETSEPDLNEARAVRRGDSCEVPRQDAGLQLLAVVQLEEEAGRRHHRALPAGAGRDGIQVPVHHAGRLPRPEPEHVRAGARHTNTPA